MGYKDENTKHRLGITQKSKPKYKCPECDGGITRKASLIVCPHCTKVIDGDKLIDNG